MIFKNLLSARWPVRELSSRRLDWPRVGLSASCPVSLQTMPQQISISHRIFSIAANYWQQRVTAYWTIRRQTRGQSSRRLVNLRTSQLADSNFLNHEKTTLYLYTKPKSNLTVTLSTIESVHLSNLP